MSKLALRTLCCAMSLALCAALPASVVAAAPAAALAVAPNAAFDQWAERFADDWVRLDPEGATTRGWFSGAEADRLDRELTPRSQAQRNRVTALAKAGLARLAEFDPKTLSALQRVSAEVMRASLGNTVRLAPYADQQNVPYAQISGVHLSLPVFFSETHPMRRPADVDAYLARLAQVSLRMDEATEVTRDAAGRGIIAPRFIIERALGQFDSFLAGSADQNAFLTTLARRMQAMPGVTPQSQADALSRATAIVKAQVLPAYARARALLAQLQPRAGSEAGVARLPDGAAAYQAALANFTSGTLTPAQIHAIGLREVARIEGEMDGHLRSLGFKDGSIKARMTALEASLQPPATPDPRPQLLARYTAIIADAQQRSKPLFNLVPAAPVEVRREPALSEASAAAHYSVPAPDGSRPGVFWAPLPGPVFRVVDMRSLSYHEAVPGHHFQLAIMQELTHLPKYRARRVFGGGSAHAEGWALYTERLAIENDWYQGDTVGLLGALDSQLFRARRLVVDTGLHSMGWTREQAIDYGIKASEVERYVVWPGQACAYMVGMLRIAELRDKARAALGPAFSLPAFHDVILKNASVPLDVLERLVDDYIAAAKA